MEKTEFSRQLFEKKINKNEIKLKKSDKKKRKWNIDFKKVNPFEINVPSLSFFLFSLLFFNIKHEIKTFQDSYVLKEKKKLLQNEHFPSFQFTVDTFEAIEISE